MGNSQSPHLITAPLDTHLDISHPRLLLHDQLSLQQDTQKHPFIIPSFKRLEPWQVELEGIQPPKEDTGNILESQVYFNDQKDLDLYLGSLLSLKQLCQISIYNQIQTKTDRHLYCLTTRQNLPSEFKPLKRSSLTGPNVNRLLDLLIFVSQTTEQTQNMFISPDEIYTSGDQFYLSSFYSKVHHRSKLLLTLIAWYYEDLQSFNDLFDSQQVISFIDYDIYLREVYMTLRSNKVPDQHITSYLIRVKSKGNYLNFNFDSFQACFKSKRSKNKTQHQKHWLLSKHNNQISFFHIKDKHLCQGRVVRKKKKIPVQHSHLLFNQDELEVLFMLDGTKNLVKTSEFDLQDCFTISDIEIKYKFPLRLKNPMMFMRGQQLYLYDQVIYRYDIEENKIYQQSKKVNDGLCLVPSVEVNYLIVRLSIDIFRHGIRVYYNDKFESVLPSGNPSIANQIQNIKIDIKHVQFCLQIYKGIFLMSASHNLWIIDLNFNCFFSFAPIEKVKQFFKSKGSQEESQFAFQILDQPFPAKWLTQHDNLNVSVESDTLHVLATVLDKLYYLQYQFILESGMLKLKYHQPLISQVEPIYSIKEQGCEQFKHISFHIYSQNFDSFKTNRWIYRGPTFLQVRNLRSTTCKGYVQIDLQTEEVLGNLRQLLDQRQKGNKTWSRFQTAMLLYTLTSIFHQISQQNISHKHFNISNLWITKTRTIKISGWSQPHRNWHISDYRDYLLVCFNVISLNSSQKITDKLLQRYDQQLSHFPILKEKMVLSLKHKFSQKKVDQEKHFIQIRQSLNKMLYPLLECHQGDKFIFSFEFNTPRFSMLSIEESKVKKMVAMIEGNNADQFTFKTTDHYIWNQQEHILYIYTSQYQMFEAHINAEQLKEETVMLEEYEYPPRNIIDCSFIHTPNGLFAFGGIAKCSKKNMQYNLDVYHFRKDTLTWLPVAKIPSPRLNPQLTLSASQKFVYLMGGDLDYGPDRFSVLLFDTTTHHLQHLIDPSFKNPFQTINIRKTHKIFQISEQHNIFLLWMVNSNTYSFNIFSNTVGGFEVNLQGKIYLQEYGQMPSVSISLVDGAIHFLRPYGKYTKISLGGLETPSVTHKTLYN